MASDGTGGGGGQIADAAADARADAAADARADATLDSAADGPARIDGGSACQTIATIDKSCTVDTDCLAVRHISNCCGQEVFLGIRATESARFQTLEAACDASYPLCGCAAGPSMTEDGSQLTFGGPKPGVTCLRGKCTTFAPLCGHVCEFGQSCVSCTDHLMTYSSCSSRCNMQTDCGPNLSCQDTPTGKFCIGAGITCNTR
jgi:hypothetical protein